MSVEIAGVSSAAATDVFDEIWAETERLEKQFSSYLPESEVNRINQNAFEKSVRLSDEMMMVLSRAREISRLTNGAFDITVSPLMRLWGFFPEKDGRMPAEIEIDKVRPGVDWEAVELDRVHKTVRFLKPKMEIDLAGLAKGYIVDRIVDLLVKRGVKSALINGGGDIYCLGQHPGGGGWRIGVEHPRQEEEVLTVLELEDQAVATSGDYRSYFIKSRKRYSHIIHPRTGHPAQSGVVETSIIAPDCMTADALATAIFVMGMEAGLRLINNLDEVEGVIVTEEENEVEVHFSRGLKNLISQP